MAKTIGIDGAPVWFEVHGDEGPPLVYLHGGFSDAGEVEPVLPAYRERFRVWTPERRGHGHTPDVEGPLHFADSAKDTIALLEAEVGGPADLVGFSDGATTALHVALDRPDLVKRMVLISGQFRYDGLTPGMFGDDPAADAAGMSEMPLAKRYAEVSPDGADHFTVVAEKVIRMAVTEPDLSPEDLARVGARTLVMGSDDDAVTLEHLVELYRSLPEAELAILPGTSHVTILEKPDLVSRLVLDFLTKDPVETRAPIRRAQRG